MCAVALEGVSSRPRSYGPRGRTDMARDSGRRSHSGIVRARVPRGWVVVPVRRGYHDRRPQPRDVTVRVGFRGCKCDGAGGFSVLARRQAATGRGLRMCPEIRPVGRRRFAYRAAAGDLNPHAQGSRHRTRLCGGRRLCGARIRCRALDASGARRQGGWPESACRAATALCATCGSPVRDPTSQSARGPLRRAREVEEVWCAQPGRQASPAPHLPALAC